MHALTGACEPGNVAEQAIAHSTHRGGCMHALPNQEHVSPVTSLSRQ